MPTSSSSGKAPPPQSSLDRLRQRVVTMAARPPRLPTPPPPTSPPATTGASSHPTQTFPSASTPAVVMLGSPLVDGGEGGAGGDGDDDVTWRGLFLAKLEAVVEQVKTTEAKHAAQIIALQKERDEAVAQRDRLASDLEAALVHCRALVKENAALAAAADGAPREVAAAAPREVAAEPTPLPSLEAALLAVPPSPPPPPSEPSPDGEASTAAAAVAWVTERLGVLAPMASSPVIPLMPVTLSVSAAPPTSAGALPLPPTPVSSASAATHMPGLIFAASPMAHPTFTWAQAPFGLAAPDPAAPLPITSIPAFAVGTPDTSGGDPPYAYLRDLLMPLSGPPVVRPSAMAAAQAPMLSIAARSEDGGGDTTVRQVLFPVFSASVPAAATEAAVTPAPSPTTPAAQLLVPVYHANNGLPPSVPTFGLLPVHSSMLALAATATTSALAPASEPPASEPPSSKPPSHPQ